MDGPRGAGILPAACNSQGTRELLDIRNALCLLFSSLLLLLRLLLLCLVSSILVSSSAATAAQERAGADQATEGQQAAGFGDGGELGI